MSTDYEFQEGYKKLVHDIEGGYRQYCQLKKRFERKHEGVVHISIVNRIREDFQEILGIYGEALTLLGTVNEMSSDDTLDRFLKELKATRNKLGNSAINLYEDLLVLEKMGMTM